MSRMAMPGFGKRPVFDRRSGRAGRRPRRVREILLAERLEDRTLLAFQDLGALRFSAGSFANNNGTISASGAIQVGLVPAGAESYTPLLEVDGALSFVAASPAQTFTISNATLSSVASGPKIGLLGATTRDFAVADLVGGGSSLSNGQVVPVAGVGLTPSLLKLVNPGDASTSDSLVSLQGKLAIDGLAGLDLPVIGSNFVTIDTSGVALTGVTVSDQQFDAFGLTVKTSGFAVDLTNSGGVSTFRFSGAVTVSDDDVSFTGALGSANTPGLVVSNGVVQTLNIGISGSIEVADLTIAANGLNYSYDAGSKLYELAGSATLSVSGTTIQADLGTSSSPGLTFQGGKIVQADAALSGQFDLFDLDLNIDQSNPLRLQYQSATQTTPSEYLITGKISVPELFDASVTLGGTGGDGKPQPGIQIIGGAFAVDGFGLSLGAVPLGAFTVQTLMVSYAKDGDSFDFGATLDLVFPEGWAVGGTVDFVAGKLSEISVSLSAGDTPIPIGDTGLFLESMSATVQNINQPENLIVSGSLTATLGEEVEIFGRSVVIAQATGSFTVDKNELILDADVDLAAETDSSGKTTGLLGDGHGMMTLDWGQQTYSLDVSASLLDGVFTFEASFSFDARGDITISAEADVNFPDGIPFIGGKRIGSLDFLFEYRPPTTTGGKAIGFVAAWLELDIFHKFDVGIQYDFEDKDKFSLIGTKGVDAIKAGSSNPAPQVFMYVSTFTVPAGATLGTLSVAWPASPTGATQTQTVAIQAGTGAIVDQKDFSDSNGLSLVPQLADPSSMVVNVVGSSTDRNASLPAGTYQLILTSDTQYATPPKFTSTFSYPTPTIQVGAIPANPGTASVTVPLAGTVASAFAATTTASLYLDTNGSGYDGVLLAKNIPYRAGGFSVPVSLNGLLPISYFVYAIINDGTNTPVRSAYSASFTPEPPLTGTLVDLNNNQGVSGWTVYLDANANGTFDPATDPFTTTGATGFYAFNAPPLPAGRPIGVGVVIPGGFRFISGPGSQNPTQVTYNGSSPVAANFSVRRLNSITGKVYNDANANGVIDNNEPGLSGWTLYLDANGNSKFDAGEVTATSNNSGDYTFLSLAGNTTYTVGLVSRPIGRQTSPRPLPPGTYTATIGAGPFQQVSGQDFGVQLLGTISGSVVGQALQNGRLNPTETPLAGWTIQLRDASGNVVATTRSASDGSYQFGQLIPGNYTVTQVIPAGWRQINPFATNLTFKAIAAPKGSGDYFDMVTADFDGDGFLDVAIATGQQRFEVKFGAGDGTFTQAFTYSQPNGGFQPLVALDADGDGRMDLALGRMVLNGINTVNSAIDVFHNRGGNRATLFGAPSSVNLSDLGIATNSGVWDLKRGDFNKDGKDDLLVAVRYSATAPSLPYYLTLLSTGSSFNLSSAVSAPALSEVAVADLNNDGNLDFVNALDAADSLGFQVHYGDGTGRFPTQVMVNPGTPTGKPSGLVTLGDINGDGLLDVAIGDLTVANVAYSLQQGAGTFGPGVTFQAVTSQANGFFPSLPPDVILKDINGDYRTDLAALSSGLFDFSSKLNVFINPGSVPAFPNGGAQTIKVDARGQFVSLGASVVLRSADVNGDGLPDFLLLSPDNSILAVLLNTTSLTPGIAVSLTNVGQVTNLPAFDNAQVGQVSGVLFDDLNRNGRREAGEPGLAGQAVYLDLNRNGSRDPGEPTAATGPAGAYAFDGFRPGEYVVRIVPAPGKQITTEGAAGIKVTIGSQPARASDFGVASRLINPIPDQVVAESSLLLITATTTAAVKSPLIFRLGAGAPDGVRIDPKTGALSWKPGEAKGPGSFPITVIAYDPFDPAVSDSATFQVTVTETRDSIQYVTALYRTVLGRDADVKGLAFWAGRLDGGISRLDIARAFWESPEHRGIQVDALFLNYLGRKPEAGTRARLVKSLLSGVSEANVARTLLTSEEYRRSHPTAESFINGLYRDVLGRTPDAAGLSFWTRAARFLGRNEIAKRFLYSQEALARQVSDAYRDILGRPADSAGAAFWTQRLAKRKLTPSQVAERFLASSEFFDLARNV